MDAQRRKRSQKKRCSWSLLVFVCLLSLFWVEWSLLMLQESTQQQQLKPTKQQTLRQPTAVVQHHCLNKDFQPKHKFSIWTMLNDNPNYIQGALKLGHAIPKHTPHTPVDQIVMELKSKPLSDEHWKSLHQAGFQRCVVHSIPAPQKTRPDLLEKFAVLHVWAMTVYQRVLFLDADTLIRQSLEPLLHMDLQGKALGVTKDIRARKWVDTFNSGVMLLEPSLVEYNRLLQLLRSDDMPFEYIMADQGFLNSVYKDDWKDIGFIYNANLALYRFQRPFWDQHSLDDIAIVHYTMSKPWNCKSKGPYGPICDLWIQAE